MTGTSALSNEISTASKPLAGKTAVVFGVASEASIAWAIAQELARRGAKIVLGYQFRYHSRIKDMVPSLPNLLDWKRCDVAKDEEMDAFFGSLTAPIDILVHSIAFAPQTAFAGAVSETSDADFTTALTVSAHSLAKLAKYAKPRMTDGGSIMTLTYLGGQKVCANYKVMGVAKAALEAYVRELAAELGPNRVRVNAISAGPVKTLAASGIPDFDLMLEYHKSVAPLRDNVTQDDVARCAAFLASDDSKMITGQTLFVDAGYNIVGVPALG
jgi:enoyl-[acyl-carrier protein] reductase I